MTNASLVRTLRLAFGGVLDLVYPPCCLICRRAARPFLCAACAACFVPIPEPVCFVCGRPDDSRSCRHCAVFAPQGDWGFATARAAAVYHGPLREAIHHFKYRHADMLAEPLGAFLANRCWVDGLVTAPVDVVVPVPVPVARERARGFNQAALLAAPVAALRGLPLLRTALRRVRGTPPQVGLSPQARRRNLVGAFAVTEPDTVRARRVLLVDDVFTTGATVSECASTLVRAGAASVHVVTLAAGG